MSNSSYVTYTKLSPNNSGARTHSIDRITPHCVVGQLTTEAICGLFTDKNKKASCNYAIGTGGKIGLCVDEGNRSWCSSSSENDQRAVTIECASDTADPYAMSDAVYAALSTLCTDICQRNGKTTLLWFGDKDTSLAYEPKDNEMVLTVHRWFANKACPGDWLFNRLGELANNVTARLGGSNVTEEPGETQNADAVSYPDTPFTVQVLVDDLNYRSEPSMSGKVNGQTGKGIFTICEVSNGWGKLRSGAGWIWLGNASYCTIQETVATESDGKAEATTESTFVPFLVRVGILKLRIRKGPGTNYAFTGKYTKKGDFTIVEVQEGTGSDSGWGRLESGAGWIALDHTTRL